MTERDRPTSDDGSPRDEALRRLLADARVTEPTPPHVVARLDAALAAASAERAEGARGTGDTGGAAPPAAGTAAHPADELADRRRRHPRPHPHRGRRLALAAAAAVVAAGLGGTLLGGLDSLTGSGGDTAASDASDAAAGESGESGAAPEAEQAPAEDQGVGGSTSYDAGGVPALTSAGFASEVRGVLGAAPLAPLADELRPRGQVERALRACGLGPAPGDASALPVTYDGTPALLLVRADPQRPRTGVVVDVVACAADGGTRTLRTARSERPAPGAP